jgi:hypothetical protein
MDLAVQPLSSGIKVRITGGPDWETFTNDFFRYRETLEFTACFDAIDLQVQIGIQSINWDHPGAFNFTGRILCRSTQGRVQPESQHGRGVIGFKHLNGGVMWDGWFELLPELSFQIPSGTIN